jgi:hypothetical protein
MRSRRSAFVGSKAESISSSSMTFSLISSTSRCGTAAQSAHTCNTSSRGGALPLVAEEPEEGSEDTGVGGGRRTTPAGCAGSGGDDTVRGGGGKE